MSHNHNHADDVALSHVVEPALPLIFEFIYLRVQRRPAEPDLVIPREAKGWRSKIWDNCDILRPSCQNMLHILRKIGSGP